MGRPGLLHSHTQRSSHPALPPPPPPPPPVLHLSISRPTPLHVAPGRCSLAHFFFPQCPLFCCCLFLCVPFLIGYYMERIPERDREQEKEREKARERERERKRGREKESRGDWWKNGGTVLKSSVCAFPSLHNEQMQGSWGTLMAHCRAVVFLSLSLTKHTHKTQTHLAFLSKEILSFLSC